jgi:hypothetical protein
MRKPDRYETRARELALAAGVEEASPSPYHALSFAPLGVVAQAYRAAGAEVFNLPDPAESAPEE